MGKTKKVVLASLVGMTMVLAVGISLLPARDLSNAAASGPSATLDMGKLLDQFLAPEGVSAFTIASSSNNVTIETPEDNAETPTLPIPLQASVSGGAGNDTVTFVANEESENSFPAPNTWRGTVFSEPASSPFFGALDLGNFLTGTANQTTSIEVYALLNTLNAAKQTTLTYEESSANALSVTISEQVTTVDANNNAYPDSPFADVASGEVWVANVTIDGTLRTVLIANLDDATLGKQIGDIVLQPTANITVTVPNKAALVNEGFTSNAEDALAIVEVVDQFASLLDTVNGDASLAARNAYAASVLAGAPAGQIPGAPFVDVTLVTTTGGGTSFQEIDDLTGSALEVGFTFSGLTLNSSQQVELWSFPTRLNGTASGLTNVTGTPAWRLADEAALANPAAGTIEAATQTLSVFAPFQGLELQSVSPTTIPENTAVDLTLTGIIATATGYNATQAEAAYTVTINGLNAAFRNYSATKQAGFAITPYDGTNPNQAFITSPALPAGTYTITLTDDLNPGNAATLSAALTVAQVFQVSTAVYNYTGTTSVVLSPPNGGFGLPDGSFLEGQTVTASLANGATPDTWTINGTTFPGSPTINFVVNGPVSISANFVPVVDVFTVSTGTIGSTSAVVTLTPASSPGEAPGDFADGTNVTASVSGAEPGVVFLRWEINGIPAGTGPTLNFTVTSDLTVVAVFGPATISITSVTPDEAWIFGGVVSRVTGTGFTAGQTVTLDGQALTPFNITATSFDITIPVNDPGNPTIANFDVDLTVTNVNGSATTTFTYKQFETVAGVTTTALILGSSTTDPAPASFQIQGSQPGTINLPALETGGAGQPVYALVRNSETNRAELETDTIPSGAPIPGVIDFALHLFTNPQVKQTTPAGPAQLYSEASQGLFDFGRPIDPTTGQPVAGSAATVSFPVDADDKQASELNAGLVRDNVKVWGVATEYDLVAGTTELALGFGGDIDFNTKQLQPVVRYQSTLVADEVSPAIASLTSPADTTSIDMVMEARLYDLNAFSLRQSSTLPAAVTDGGRLQNTTGTLILDEDEDNTPFTIVSPRGGLGFIDRVEYVLSESPSTIVATTAGGDIRIPTGDTGEFTLALTSPANPTRSGIVDVLVYLEGDTTVPSFSLERVIEFRAAGDTNPPNFLLLLLGLLAAILGLAAGGDSGGGGGGPCFIATAAYGTPLDGDINALRSVRDEYLLNNTFGSTVVDAYYSTSPAIASFVAEHPAAATAVRVVLVPVVTLSKIAMASPGLIAAMMVAMMALWVLRRATRVKA